MVFDILERPLGCSSVPESAAVPVDYHRATTMQHRSTLALLRDNVASAGPNGLVPGWLSEYVDVSSLIGSKFFLGGGHHS